MSDAFLGEIRIFAGNFPPKNWAFCNGQLMPIQQNTELFSILGTKYGGDGKTTFALPDLRGRAPLHQGAGPGLSNRTIGEEGGSATVTLLTTEMPTHTHQVKGQTSNMANQKDPSGHVWSTTGARGRQIYYNTANMQMSPYALGVTGGSQPHNNMQPYVGINYIIALDGVFPSKA